MKRHQLVKSNVTQLRGARHLQRIIYSLKSMPGRKINAMFIQYHPFIFQGGPVIGLIDNRYDLYNLDIYGMRVAVTIYESNIYQVKFVDTFSFENMDFDVGI